MRIPLSWFWKRQKIVALFLKAYVYISLPKINILRMFFELNVLRADDALVVGLRAVMSVIDSAPFVLLRGFWGGLEVDPITCPFTVQLYVQDFLTPKGAMSWL